MVVIVGKDEKSWHRCSFRETSVCLHLSCFFSPSILHVSGQAVHDSPYRVFEYIAVTHSSCKGETPPKKKKKPDQPQEALGCMDSDTGRSASGEPR